MNLLGCVLSHLRLALWVVLNELPDALNVIGPDCGSWGIPARHTSGRSYINPMGCLFKKWITGNNMLVSRTLGCKQYGTHASV